MVFVCLLLFLYYDYYVWLNMRFTIWKSIKIHLSIRKATSRKKLRAKIQYHWLIFRYTRQQVSIYGFILGWLTHDYLKACLVSPPVLFYCCHMNFASQKPKLQNLSNSTVRSTSKVKQPCFGLSWSTISTFFTFFAKTAPKKKEKGGR